MNSEKMARHAEAFGEAHSKALGFNLDVYDETLCRECSLEHRCCDYLVRCAPFEALGIICFLKVTHGDQGMNDMLGLIKRRANEVQEHIKKYTGENGTMDKNGEDRMVKEWAATHSRCVFYNHEHKKCSIYPVRPIACRRAYGTGGCGDDNVTAAIAHEQAEIRRLTRIKITEGDPEEQHQEMTILITYLSAPVPIIMSKQEQAMLDQEPTLITDEEQLWGADGPPKPIDL